MKTDELIELLARGAGPAPKAVAARRLAPVAVLGVAASTLLSLTLIGPIPPAFYATAAPWIKLGYAASIAAAGAWLTARLARPAARASAPARALALVVAAMSALGLTALLAATPAARGDALLGHSWWSCPWNVLAFSLPALAGALWAVRGLAPTRPRAAGLAAGIFAGALGAFGYALSCPELSPAFVALWYTLGIGLTGLLGALLGPRLLRW